MTIWGYNSQEWPIKLWRTCSGWWYEEKVRRVKETESTWKCSLLVPRHALLRASVGGRESGLHIISITSAVLHNIKNLGGWELRCLTGSFGGGSWTAYNSGPKSCYNIRRQTVVEYPGGQPQMSNPGRGGRGLRMWKTAMCRHIWNKTREPVIFYRMEGAGGTSRCAVATKLGTPLMNALIWF